MMTPDPELMACIECLCLASRRAARAVTAAYDKRLRPHGLRITQFSILVVLMLMGPTPMGEVAKFLGLERTTLTRNLDLLESKGWIESRPGETDARARVVSTTAKGAEIVKAAFPQWRQAQDDVAAAFGPVGVEALKSLARTAIQ
jgi:DNA-binding MarR family transcriptional regulator